MPYGTEEADLREKLTPFGAIIATEPATLHTSSSCRRTAWLRTKASHMLDRNLRVDYRRARTPGDEEALRTVLDGFETSIQTVYFSSPASSPAPSSFVEFLSVERATHALTKVGGSVTPYGPINLEYALSRKDLRMCYNEPAAHCTAHVMALSSWSGDEKENSNSGQQGRARDGTDRASERPPPAVLRLVPCKPKSKSILARTWSAKAGGERQGERRGGMGMTPDEAAVRSGEAGMVPCAAAGRETQVKCAGAGASAGAGAGVGGGAGVAPSREGATQGLRALEVMRVRRGCGVDAIASAGPRRGAASSVWSRVREGKQGRAPGRRKGRGTRGGGGGAAEVCFPPSAYPTSGEAAVVIGDIGGLERCDGIGGGGSHRLGTVALCTVHELMGARTENRDGNPPYCLYCMPLTANFSRWHWRRARAPRAMRRTRRSSYLSCRRFPVQVQAQAQPEPRAEFRLDRASERIDVQAAGAIVGSSEVEDVVIAYVAVAEKPPRERLARSRPRGAASLLQYKLEAALSYPIVPKLQAQQQRDGRKKGAFGNVRITDRAESWLTTLDS
ncbi:hypothetical protein K438DRAFT_1778443 [Mycena galopus ATCC 62051]|nr:hypothetical protein K438DRAFT_1778443 [Mycena galopus ATCC 62051]